MIGEMINKIYSSDEAIAYLTVRAFFMELYMKTAKEIPYSIDELMEIFDVDLDSGKLYWSYNWANSTYAGKEAGSTNKLGYRCVSINKSIFLRHRLIFYIATGEQPKTIDHINGVPGDDRIANLQALSQQKNLWKKRISKDKNRHGYAGVVNRGGCFYANITVNGRRINLGKFNTAKDAGDAYSKARIIVMKHIG